MLSSKFEQETFWWKIIDPESFSVANWILFWYYCIHKYWDIQSLLFNKMLVASLSIPSIVRDIQTISSQSTGSHREKCGSTHLVYPSKCVFEDQAAFTGSLYRDHQFTCCQTTQNIDGTLSPSGHIDDRCILHYSSAPVSMRRLSKCGLTVSACK